MGSYKDAINMIEQLMMMYESIGMEREQKDAATNALMVARAMIYSALDAEIAEFEAHQWDAHDDATYGDEDLPF